MENLDKGYGELSASIIQWSEDIKALTDALTTGQDALMEDRKAIKELAAGVKDLVNEVRNHRLVISRQSEV